MSRETLPVILALDLDSPAEAERVADELGGRLDYIKIGPGLFALGGTSFVREMVDRGFKVFLDLKLHDIPNTVKIAVQALCDVGLWSLTLHAAGGRQMMEEAAAERNRMGSAMKLFGVTVLTSLSEKIWAEATPGCPMGEALRHRAWLCGDSGMDGVVCSPLDLPVVASMLPDRVLKIVPGVRMKDGSDDQSRVATPCQAFRNGADYIVVGRPIYRSADMDGALSRIAQSIREGLTS